MSAPKPSTCTKERFNELLKKAQHVKETENGIEEDIVKQMDAVRLHEGLNAADFCKIVGLTKTNYYHIFAGTRGLSIQLFVRFCRIFGYDLSTFSGESFLDSQDSVFRELALFLGRLSPETIEQINRDIQEGSESENNKRRADILLTAMAKAIQKPDFKPLTFYADDAQEKAD